MIIFFWKHLIWINFGLCEQSLASGNQICIVTSLKSLSVWKLLVFAYLCFPLLTIAYLCLPLLTSAYLCLPLLTFAHLCSPLLPLLTFAYLCLPLLTFAYLIPSCVLLGLTGPYLSLLVLIGPGLELTDWLTDITTYWCAFTHKNKTRPYWLKAVIHRQFYIMVPENLNSSFDILTLMGRKAR